MSDHLIHSIANSPSYLRARRSALSGDRSLLQVSRSSWVRGTLRYYIWDRKKAEGECLRYRHLMISVTDPGSKPAKIPDCQSRIALLRLSFWDTEDRYHGDGVISAHHIDELVRFVNSYSHEVNSIVVHCEMGVSRSAAIVAALIKMAGHSPYDIFANYLPNLLVYSEILLHSGYEPEEIDIE